VRKWERQRRKKKSLTLAQFAQTMVGKGKQGKTGRVQIREGREEKVCAAPSFYEEKTGKGEKKRGWGGGEEGARLRSEATSGSVIEKEGKKKEKGKGGVSKGKEEKTRCEN